ncbi:hypothetical protein [Pseudofulvibacter geojedonensis]|uniref:Uncharacterized protein n=1 Tax=Pseudofulvibacter geojedonensis TaxID=1123758 RepID=A0ABW3I169_9FLAO
MEKSIETIWENGFLNNQDLIAPRLNEIYNKKSQHIVEVLVKKMENEVVLLFIITFFNLVLGSILAKSFVWGIICALTVIPWIFVAKKQLQAIKHIEFTVNCYDYLKRVREKLKQITMFNFKLSVLSVPIVLTPLLIYTYFNNIDKTFGEIMGNANLGGSNKLIFIFIPVVTILSALFFKIMLRLGNKTAKKIEQIVKDMEELRAV